MPRKPIATEKRESRINLLLVPSLYKNIVTLADSQELSINEFITRLLEKTAEKNSAVIEKFQAARDVAKSEYVDAD
jgi:hypothetical protein